MVIYPLYDFQNVPDGYMGFSLIYDGGQQAAYTGLSIKPIESLTHQIDVTSGSARPEGPAAAEQAVRPVLAVHRPHRRGTDLGDAASDEPDPRLEQRLPGRRERVSAEPQLPGQLPGKGWAVGKRLRRIGSSRAVGALLHALTVIAFVVVITFALVRIVPGDPVVSIEGINSTPQARAAMRAQLHLNRPVLVQFELYVRSVATGDLGKSLIQQGRPVSEIIKSTLPVTLALIITTVIISVLIGVPLGLMAALGGELVDFSIRTFVTVLLALPPFFLGLILILFVSVRGGLLPAGGWGSGAPEDVKYLVLPALALAAFLTPLIVRVCRQAANARAARAVDRGRDRAGDLAAPDRLLPHPPEHAAAGDHARRLQRRRAADRRRGRRERLRAAGDRPGARERDQHPRLPRDPGDRARLRDRGRDREPARGSGLDRRRSADEGA